jgi:FkbM family methyltransferase
MTRPERRAEAVGVQEGYAPDLVFDVGVHDGEDTDFYLAKGFRVVGVEAMPALSSAAASRFRRYVESGQLCIRNVAVAEDPGPISFYVNPKSEWGTIRKSWAERNAHYLGSAPSTVIEVPGVRFADLLAEHGVPYYLKVDIEGADLLCLEALAEFPERPKYVSVESDKRSWSALRREFDLLGRLGYRRFKVVAQHKVHKQRCPRPAREGKAIDYRFTRGASGSFGEEAPGRWLSRRQALLRYRLIFLRYRLYGDSGLVSRIRPVRLGFRALFGAAGWYDTHATR